jgi:hypothetical protein
VSAWNQPHGTQRPIDYGIEHGETVRTQDVLRRLSITMTVPAMKNRRGSRNFWWRG